MHKSIQSFRDISEVYLYQILQVSDVLQLVDINLVIFHGNVWILLLQFYQFLYTTVLISRDLQQTVSVSNRFSSWRIMTGVPQVSILEPLLFSIYINDITETLRHSRYHLYAEDLQLYIHIRSYSTHDCILKINNDLDSISLWTEKLNSWKIAELSNRIPTIIKCHVILNSTPI